MVLRCSFTYYWGRGCGSHPPLTGRPDSSGPASQCSRALRSAPRAEVLDLARQDLPLNPTSLPYRMREAGLNQALRMAVLPLATGNDLLPWFLEPYILETATFYV